MVQGAQPRSNHQDQLGAKGSGEVREVRVFIDRHHEASGAFNDGQVVISGDLHTRPDDVLRVNSPT